MVEPTHKGVNPFSILYNNISLCLLRLFSSVFHPNSWYSFCLEELHLKPVIIRPASICTLSNKSDSFLVFNASFNNISIISWRLVLLVEETGVPGENHRSAASH